MSEGYPDYARLSRSGGVQLYSATGIAPPYFTELFQGYVGLWPYVTLATTVGASADTALIDINYCSDSTFLVQIGFRRIIRAGGSFGVTQYANLSEWMQFYYSTISGMPIIFNELSLYGSDGYATQFNLTSLDVPIFQFNGSVAATTLVNETIQHIQPGPAKLYINTALTTWVINVQYFDYGTNTWLTLAVFNNTKNGTGGVFDMPMIDTPMRLQLDNTTAAAGTFQVSWLSG